MKNFFLLFLLSIVGKVSGQTIVIFQDPDYYELNRNVPNEECLDEVYNITTILGTYGYTTINPINDILDFSSSLNGVDVLIFPLVGDFFHIGDVIRIRLNQFK